MIRPRAETLATLIVVGTGAFWGFYWLPVRELDTAGLAGAWGTAAIAASAVVLLAPFALVSLRRSSRPDLVTLGFIALGGLAFLLYSVSFVYGRVAIVILLFFLTPVWSTLIGRFVLGWRTPGLRLLAIAVGIAGLCLMLGAEGTWPVPRSLGEWLALVSGLLWSVATTGMRARPKIPTGLASFVFALGAMLAALFLAPLLAPLPTQIPASEAIVALGWAVVAGGLWWGASLTALMWAAPQIDPARTGILLMAEVLVGAASAAMLAGEFLGPMELAGGALVLTAGVLEVWPVKHQSTGPSHQDTR